jgi:hypothetical protein
MSRDRYRIARVAALAATLIMLTSVVAQAEGSYAAWRIAHERMLAKWRCSEPRCGWTVGGYTCSSPRRARSLQAMTK